MAVISTWFRLDRASRRLLLRAALRLLATIAALIGLSSTSAHRWALSKASLPLTRRTPVYPPERIAWAVSAAGRRLLGSSCLAEAITTCWLLRTQGTNAVLRIGVATEPLFKAHAWVECDGKIVIGSDSSERYQALPRLPVSPS
jgi:hypothetical protein